MNKKTHFILAAALLAMLSLVALSALSLASAAPFFPPGYNHAEHVHEHAEGAIFFEAGPIAQAGGLAHIQQVGRSAGRCRIHAIDARPSRQTGRELPAIETQDARTFLLRSAIIMPSSSACS